LLVIIIGVICALIRKQRTAKMPVKKPYPELRPLPEKGKDD